MNARAADADEDAQVPTCPSRICAQAASARLVFPALRCSSSSSDIRLFLLQSEHILLGSNFNSDLMVAWFFAARSAAGFGGRLDMVFLLALMDSTDFNGVNGVEL